MSQVKQFFTPGRTYFFTARLADRHASLLVDHIELLRGAMRATLRRHPFVIDAIAVLPNAVHTVWTLPPGDTDVARRWKMLKSQFTQSLCIAQGMQGMGQRSAIWQHFHWSHPIADAADLARHVAMIHASPMQAGLCAQAADWPHSSIHRFEKSDAPGAPMPAPIRAATFREEGFAHHP